MLRKVKGKISYYAKSDRGLKRNINQDAAAIFKEGNIGLFVLADGMGGHCRGELASREVTMEFDTFWNEVWLNQEGREFHTLVKRVQQVILNVNYKIYQKYNQSQVCGTTLVVLLVVKDCYAIFSVGDSRIYSYYKKKMKVCTVDDIWDNLPSTVNSYTTDEILQDSRCGSLVQAVGTKPEINIHVTTDYIMPKQVFLLCSDGLFKFCGDLQIKKGLQKANARNLETIINEYMQVVYNNGAPDNVSMVLVRVE